MKKKSHGVLIIHGFASSLDSVRMLEPPLQALGVPTRMRLLRGHGQPSPEALRGVTWHDWLADARDEMHALLGEADKAILVAHSMGALLALMMAADEPDAVDSIVLAAAAVQLDSPLAPGRPLHWVEPLVSRLFARWDLPPEYSEPGLAKYDTNYHWAPMEAISSFLQLTQVARKRLPEVCAPALILHSRRDRTAAPESANIILESISTPAELKRIQWFEVTSHEMFQDCERQAVTEAAVDYVRGRLRRRSM